MENKDGGAAFPFTRDFVFKGIEGQEHMPGMSLRDWFAGQVLASGKCKYDYVYKDEIAQWCYEIADAMLREREKSC